MSWAQNIIISMVSAEFASKCGAQKIAQIGHSENLGFILTQVILSHFLQAENDPLEINAEVQWHQWHSSKKWCVRYALLWMVSKVIEITTSIKEDWNSPTKWSLISLASYFCSTPETLGICLDRWDWNNPVVLTHIQEKFET